MNESDIFIAGLRGQFAVWLCPHCGRTVKAPRIDYVAPNIDCWCQPSFIQRMVQVWPVAGTPEEKEEPND